MPSGTLAAPSGRYLSFAEREQIARVRVGGCWMREIARRIGRSPSTSSRELRRNAATLAVTRDCARTCRTGWRALSSGLTASRSRDPTLRGSVRAAGVARTAGGAHAWRLDGRFDGRSPTISSGRRTLSGCCSATTFAHHPQRSRVLSSAELAVLQRSHAMNGGCSAKGPSGRLKTISSRGGRRRGVSRVDAAAERVASSVS